MDELSDDETHYRLAAATLLTYPGIPFIYYGEEVGMKTMPLGNFPAGSDWPQRGPMSWDMQPSVTDNAKSGDFADLDLFKAAPNIATHNVALQSADPQSLWSFYRTLLNLRKNSPALQSGNYVLVKTGATSLVFERRLNTQRMLVAINYGTAAEPLALTGLSAQASYASVLAYHAGASTLPTTVVGAASLILPPQSVQVFTLTVSDEAPYRGPLYVRGTMNNWAATPASRLSYSGSNRLELTLALTEAKTYLFKIADEGWLLHEFGGVTPAGATSKLINVTSGAAVELEPVGWKNAGDGHEIQIDVVRPGRYRFVLDSSEPLAPRLTVEKQ
jgi:hypothetical protein